MKTRCTVALSVLAGVAVGAAAVQALHAQAKPPAYVIAEIDVTNVEPYDKEYVPPAAKAVTDGGGKYIVRGGATEVLEGDWNPKRIVVLQFDSMERAKEWLNCEEYREPRKMRHRTAKTRMILLEGL